MEEPMKLALLRRHNQIPQLVDENEVVFHSEYTEDMRLSRRKEWLIVATILSAGF